MKSLVSPAKSAIRAILPSSMRRRVHQFIHGRSPMENVMKKLKQRNIALHEMDALEVFGRDGRWHTQSYIGLVRSLEVWEIQEKYRQVLQKNLPGAKIKITDSFLEVKRIPSKYDLVVVDNSMGIFVDDPYDGSTPTEYCEHFDLFPSIFRILKNEAVVIVNVIPKTNAAAMEKYPLLFDSRQLHRRAKFYSTEHPENISLSEMTKRYSDLADQAGFKMDWAVSELRGGVGIVHYLAFKLERK